MPFVALHFPSEIDKKYLNVIIDKYLSKTTNPVNSKKDKKYFHNKHTLSEVQLH